MIGKLTTISEKFGFKEEGAYNGAIDTTISQWDCAR